MKNFFTRFWFFVGIIMVIIIAFAFPFIGQKAKEWRLLDIGIFIAFLITGLKLETSSMVREVKNIKGISAALVSTFIIFPGLALVLAQLFFKSTVDFTVGSCIIAVAPVTVASGIVMTTLANGNVPLSLFICVASNLLSIFTIPISLDLVLKFDQSINLPVWKMMQSLVMIVLVPTLAGQLLRIKVKEKIAPYNKAFSIFSQGIVLLIIFNAVSSSTSKITAAGAAIIYVLLFMIFLHSLILSFNFGIARLIKLNRSSTAAFTIQTSQKTLTVSYIVWAGYFATGFPLAMIPAIGYHLTQMVMDTLVAQWFRKKTDNRGRMTEDRRPKTEDGRTEKSPSLKNNSPPLVKGGPGGIILYSFNSVFKSPVEVSRRDKEAENGKSRTEKTVNL